MEKAGGTLLLCWHNAGVAERDYAVPLVSADAPTRSRAFGPMEKAGWNTAFVQAQRSVPPGFFRTALRFREHYTTQICFFPERACMFVDIMAYMPYNAYKGDTMAKYEVIFYEKKNGDVPVQDFLMGLDKKMRAKLSAIISILQQYGNQLREPYSKYLDDGIFEIRGKIGSDISRVLYFSTVMGK